MQNASFQSLPLTRCVVWADNPRKTIGDLAELTESVRTVRRDLDVIGKVLPVTRDGHRYRVESRRAAAEQERAA